MDTDTAIKTVSAPATAPRKRNLWRVERSIPHKGSGPPLQMGDMLEFIGLRPWVTHRLVVWRFTVVTSSTVRIGKRITMSNQGVRRCLRPVEVED